MSKYTKKNLEETVKHCTSYSDVARNFGLAPVGGTLGHIKALIIKYGIDCSHFTGKGHFKGKVSNRRKSAAEFLVKNDKRQKGYKLIRSLLEIGRKEQCEECGTGTERNGKKLVLTADHINGDRTDHRQENLKPLCPNCHSQTDTFAGRNKKF